jgi:hypothetical protein
MLEDPIVADVRKYREEIAARFGYDIRAIAAETKKREQQSGRKLVSFEQKEGKVNPPESK